MSGLRLLFPTQSIGLRLFWRLWRTLQAEGGTEAAGFFVTNRLEYARFVRAFPDVAESGADILKEWDLVAEARRLAVVDTAALDEWERTIGDPTLWNALIIDRRLGFKLRAQFVQDYAPPYDHDRLLRLLEVALRAISAQFERVRPHAVIGLNAVTLYDYLYYLMARRYGVPYMQLKLTRVRNYVSLYTEPFELSPHIVESFRRLRGDPGALTDAERAAYADAQTLIDEIRGTRLVYEGAIRTPGAPAQRLQAKGALTDRMRSMAERLALQRNNPDPHYPPPLRYVLETKLLRPWRRRAQSRWFDVIDAAAYARENDGRYALYPLNTEPEVALLAYGRPYRNQIETVRNVAASLPVGWKLVVKEHPNAFGYRTAGFYRKLKQIPNVVLAAATADTGRLTDGAGLVALVFGTIGLEAIVKRKPVIVLCETPYGVFPRDMVRFADRPWRMADDIRALLDTHRHDESAVEAFIAAHMTTGIRLNLFTGLLAKGGRESVDAGRSIEEQYAALARYTRRRIAEEQARLRMGVRTAATGG